MEPGKSTREWGESTSVAGAHEVTFTHDELTELSQSVAAIQICGARLPDFVQVTGSTPLWRDDLTALGLTVPSCRGTVRKSRLFFWYMFGPAAGK
jgi:hypothetical protein